MFQWYYLALLSSVFLGVETLIEKGTLRQEYASAYTASFTMLAGVIALVFIPFANFSIGLLDVILIYITGTVATITYLLNARVYRHGHISVASPELGVLPILFVIFLAFGTLHESLTYVQYLFMALLMVSAYMLMRNKAKNPFESYFEKRKYIYLIILSSFLTALFAVLTKYLLDSGLNIFTFLILAELSMAVNMAIYMTIKYGGVKEIVSNYINHKAPITSIALLTTADRLCYYASMSLAFASLVAPVRNTISVIITVLIGGLVFNEANLSKKLLFSAIMIVSAYFIIIPFTI